MLTKKNACVRSSVLVGALVMMLTAVFQTAAYGETKKTKVLFIQQDKVVAFDLTPPNPDQPLGGGVGAQVGTATGAINGTSVVNFKMTFTSNPFVRPLTFNFNNRIGITDTNGDQIIFRCVGTGRFNPPLIDPTLPVNVSPFQVFGTAATPASLGPLTGTCEVVAASGKFAEQFQIGQVFPYRSIFANPANPPTPPGTTGSSYAEVFED